MNFKKTAVKKKEINIILAKVLSIVGLFIRTICTQKINPVHSVVK